jgi:hypothetical protein
MFDVAPLIFAQATGGRQVRMDHVIRSHPEVRGLAIRQNVRGDRVEKQHPLSICLTRPCFGSPLPSI